MATAMLKNGPLSIGINANGMDYYEFGITGCEVGGVSRSLSLGRVAPLLPAATVASLADQNAWLAVHHLPAATQPRHHWLVRPLAVGAPLSHRELRGQRGRRHRE